MVSSLLLPSLLSNHTSGISQSSWLDSSCPAPDRDWLWLVDYCCMHAMDAFTLFFQMPQRVTTTLQLACETKFYHLLVCRVSTDLPHYDLVTHGQLTSQSCHRLHCGAQLISLHHTLESSLDLTSLLCAIPGHTMIWGTLHIHDNEHCKKTGNKKDKSNIKHQ